MDKFNLCNRRYLGNKNSLLYYLDEIMAEIIGNVKSVADVFGGTGVVGEFFLNKEKDVYFNDILLSNYKIYNCFFGEEKYNIKKLEEYLGIYNSLDSNKLEENYFSKNFSNTYFDQNNCKKIGYIREDIEFSKKYGIINEREADILITSLIYAIDKIANTVGHYDAYIEKDVKLKKDFKMKFPNIKEYRGKSYIYRQNANNLVKEIKCDLVYIDPPYNSRQYCDLYHLLENLAEWKKPKVFYKAKKMNRDHIKSKYSMKSATDEFRNLINSIESKYIIVSYNSTGGKGASRSSAKISDKDLIDILSQKGEIKIFEKEYNTFTTGKSAIDNLSERFFVCKVKNNVKIQLKPIINVHKEKEFVKTPLNYTGGKHKLLKQLINAMPKDMEERTFIDLFTGGANVGLNISANEIICNDIQSSVIRLYRLFDKYNAETIIRHVEEIINRYGLSNSTMNGYKFYNCNSSKGLGNYNRDKYNKLKVDYNNMKNKEEKDYYFFVLLIFGFNNQIRFNLSGKFNMPVGKRDFNNSIRQNLITTVRKIKEKNIKFISKDFRKIRIEQYNKPFVYCDPPYLLTTASYNENNKWTESDERDLLILLKKISDQGIDFMLSNVLEHSGLKHSILIDWAIENRFNIIHLKHDYKNSSYQKKDKQSISDEIIITNYNNF